MYSGEAINVDAKYTESGRDPFQIANNTNEGRGGISLLSQQSQSGASVEALLKGNWVPIDDIDIIDNSETYPGVLATMVNNQASTITMTCGNYVGGLTVGLIDNSANKFVFDAPTQGICRFFGLGGVMNIGAVGYSDFGNGEAMGNNSGGGYPAYSVNTALTIVDINTLP